MENESTTEQLDVEAPIVATADSDVPTASQPVHHGFPVLAAGQFGVRLLQHIGRNEFTGEDEAHAQDQIFVGDYRVGYVGHQPGAKVALIVPWERIAAIAKARPADVQAEISRLITAESDGVPPGGFNIAAPIRRGDRVKKSKD